MLTVTLYTKDPCPLCDDVKAYLQAREDVWPHELVEVDITADHDTYMRYRFSIPVVDIGDTRLEAPIMIGALERALRENSQ